VATAVRETDPTAPARPRIVGGTGTTVWGGNITDLDPNTETRGDKWYGTPSKMGLGQHMLRDGHCRKSFDALRDPLLAANWTFVPPVDDPLARQVADYCQHVFTERNSFKRALRWQALYIADGFSLLEMTDQVLPISADRFPDAALGGHGLVPTGFHQRPAWTVCGFHQRARNTATLRAVDQLIVGSDGELPGERRISADRLIRATWEQNGADFAGFPILRSSWSPFKAKKMLTLVELIRHEREHTGTPTFELPEGATDAMVDEAREIAGDLRANSRAFLVLPHGVVFKWSTSDSSTDIDKTIERLNRDIAYNVGATFLLHGSKNSSGSYALASTQSGHYNIGLDNHADFVEGAWNCGLDGWSPVERVVRKTFGADAPIPTLRALNMPTRDWAVLLPIVANLIMTGGLRVDKPVRDTIRSALFMPPEDPATLEAPPTQGSNPAGSVADTTDPAARMWIEGLIADALKAPTVEARIERLIEHAVEAMGVTA